MKRLLLISNSTQHGRGYLDHVEGELRDFLGPARRIFFVPFALFDREAYTAKAHARFAALGRELAALDDAEAIFVGGGNTFRLLKELQDRDLIEPVRRRVEQGTPYVGASAGSIVAGPTLKTTKDMPIVQPRSFEALALVRFQISPHYLDPDPQSRHMGETQEERILQFLEENDAPVLGLREGGWVRVEGGSARIGGAADGRLFRRGQAAVERRPGEELEDAR
jgi:dipeptidase E